MVTELKSIFHLDEVDHDEVLALLLSHFGGSSHAALSRIHTYQKHDHPEIKLDIELDRHGQIKQILLGEAFPEVELKDVAEKIRNGLIDNQSPKVAEVVGFAVS